MGKHKVTIIGAGNVGATTAQRIFDKGYSDVVLIDILEGIPQGKSLDILESGSVLGSDSKIIGDNNYESSKNSDVVVITAGIARKPGMSRDDLLLTNMKIVGEVTKNVCSYSPNAILIVVSNPLDAMVQHAHKISKFPKQRVLGMAGILDTARFKSFLAEELNVSVNSISAYVLGGHGDTMVPVIKSTTVGGVPVSELIPSNRLEEIVQRTRDGGAEIVGFLKTGSAYYAPSSSAVAMVEAILLDSGRILPACALLQGEYGVNDLYCGVPVELGATGVRRIIELDINDSELAALQESVKAVKDLSHQLG